ncbi:MAG: isoaspartyl peptidase/L-asparaginase [Candidatus Dormiibacterota bacterium]
MLVAASANGIVGIPAAINVLMNGGSALDAVEVAAKAVEDNPDDHTVGFSGLPNVDGIVELDASIMEGTSRRAGAVGGLRDYRHAISVARYVMERLPHVLVVGSGAGDLAAEMGLQAEDLLTPEAKATWEAGLKGEVSSASELGVRYQRVQRPAPSGGTVNFIARDKEGHLASAVSTSGAAWKHPGRLGDSPIIGAGNYCDDRYGAATCTGWGELTIRASTARLVVEMMRRGAGPAEACIASLEDLHSLGGIAGVPVIVNVVAVSPSGEVAAASTKVGTEYAYWEEGMTDPVLRGRTLVELGDAAAD